jgi:hypothetical protein
LSISDKCLGPFLLWRNAVELVVLPDADLRSAIITV